MPQTATARLHLCRSQLLFQPSKSPASGQRLLNWPPPMTRLQVITQCIRNECPPVWAWYLCLLKPHAAPTALGTLNPLT